MAYHRYAIRGQHHVQFETIDPERERRGESLQRVLWKQPSRPAMALQFNRTPHAAAVSLASCCRPTGARRPPPADWHVGTCDWRHATGTRPLALANWHAPNALVGFAARVSCAKLLRRQRSG